MVTCLWQVKLEKELHTCLSGLKERKHQRLAHVEALRRRDAACCARLGEEPMRLDVPEGAVPSGSQVTALENRVHELTQDMDHRLHEVRRLRDALQECLHDLDLASPEDYSKWPLTAEPDVAERFPLSLPALVELESVLKKAQHRRETAAERYRELMARIDLLWKRLGSSQEDRKSFLDSLPNSQPASLRLVSDRRSSLLGRIPVFSQISAFALPGDRVPFPSARGRSPPLGTAEAGERGALHRGVQA